MDHEPIKANEKKKARLAICQAGFLLSKAAVNLAGRP
jgi:hypothetical protein